MLRRINFSTIAKGVLTIAGLYWFLVLTSICGLTNFLEGRVMQSSAGLLTGIMLLLPILAVAMLMLAPHKDDSAQIN